MLYFGFCGNYIHHANRSSSFSIRTKYTLENEVIWQSTHKFCGALWVSGACNVSYVLIQ